MGQQAKFRETESGRQKKPVLALPSDNTISIFLANIVEDFPQYQGNSWHSSVKPKGSKLLNWGTKLKLSGESTFLVLQHFLGMIAPPCMKLERQYWVLESALQLIQGCPLGADLGPTVKGN